MDNWKDKFDGKWLETRRKEAIKLQSLPEVDRLKRRISNLHLKATIYRRLLKEFNLELYDGIMSYISGHSTETIKLIVPGKWWESVK